MFAPWSGMHIFCACVSEGELKLCDWIKICVMWNETWSLAVLWHFQWPFLFNCVACSVFPMILIMVVFSASGYSENLFGLLKETGFRDALTHFRSVPFTCLSSLCCVVSLASPVLYCLGIFALCLCSCSWHFYAGYLDLSTVCSVGHALALFLLGSLLLFTVRAVCWQSGVQIVGVCSS